VKEIPYNFSSDDFPIEWEVYIDESDILVVQASSEGPHGTTDTLYWDKQRPLLDMRSIPYMAAWIKTVKSDIRQEMSRFIFEANIKTRGFEHSLECDLARGVWRQRLSKGGLVNDHQYEIRALEGWPMCLPDETWHICDEMDEKLASPLDRLEAL